MKHLIGILASALVVIAGGVAGGIAQTDLWTQSQEATPTTVIQATLLAPPRVPPPIDRPGPDRVVVTLETTKEKGALASGVEYRFWTFGGPGRPATSSRARPWTTPSPVAPRASVRTDRG